MSEKGISIVEEKIHSQWKAYDSDTRYSNVQLRLNSIDFDSAIKRTEVVFTPTYTETEGTIEEMGMVYAHYFISQWWIVF